MDEGKDRRQVAQSVVVAAGYCNERVSDYPAETRHKWKVLAQRPFYARAHAADSLDDEHRRTGQQHDLQTRCFLDDKGGRPEPEDPTKISLAVEIAEAFGMIESQCNAHEDLNEYPHDRNRAKPSHCRSVTRIRRLGDQRSDLLGLIFDGPEEEVDLVVQDHQHYREQEDVGHFSDKTHGVVSGIDEDPHCGQKHEERIQRHQVELHEARKRQYGTRAPSVLRGWVGEK